eukprot:TCONS_00058502-protein
MSLTTIEPFSLFCVSLSLTFGVGLCSQITTGDINGLIPCQHSNESLLTNTNSDGLSYFCQYFSMNMKVNHGNKQLLVDFSWKYKRFSSKIKFSSYRLPQVTDIHLSCQGCSVKKWIIYNAVLVDKTGHRRKMVFNVSLSSKTRHIDCKFRMGSHFSDNLCIGQVKGVATVPVHKNELNLIERMDDATRYKIIAATAGSVLLLMLLTGLVSYIIHRILNRKRNKQPKEEEDDHLGFFSPIDERIDRLYERYM